MWQQIKQLFHFAAAQPPALGASTRSRLAIYQRRDQNLSATSREKILRNPYIYAALRNTADELLGKWHGAGGYAPQGDADAHLRRPPQILAASDDPAHQAQAEHLRWNIDHRLQRGWAEVLRQLLRAREHGKAVNEIVWAYQLTGQYQGTWVIDDIIDCDPDEFSFKYSKNAVASTGATYYQRQIYYQYTTPLPERKFVVFSFDKRAENDEGNSILNKLDLFDWYQRNNFIFWMTDLNRYGSPLIVGKAPRNAPATQREALLNAIDSIQQETGIVISEDEKIELLQAQRNGASGFESLDAIVNKIISVVITGNALSMEGGDKGSFSLAKVTTAEIRTIILYALARQLDDVVNRQIIAPFMAFNYPLETEYPYQQILPPRLDDVSNPVSTPMAQVATLTPETPMLRQFAEKQLRPVDLLAENAVAAGLQIMEDEWMTPLAQRIATAPTPAEAQAAVKAFTPAVDAFADLLQRSIITAHVLGRWQIAQDVAESAAFASDEEINTLLRDPLLVAKAQEIVLSKKLMTATAFKQLDDQAKRKAFTIAGKQSLEVMGFVQQAVADAITVGGDVKSIAQAARQAFRRYGVTYQTPYHAETVFRTNIESALHDARWQMLQQPDIKGKVAFLQYVTMEDPRVRPNHRRMHGVTRPVDDAVWQVWYPPNGFNCRCTVRVIPISQAQGVTPTPVLPNVQPDDGFASGPGDWWRIES